MTEKIPPQDPLATVFQKLRTVMLPYAEKLVCKHDEPGRLYIDTAQIMKNKQPLFFGAVQIKKRYVAYHLMPVYVNPDLLEGMSPALKRRMHGKSCFNFTKIDDDQLLTELSALTEAGYEFYRSKGYV